ncbi:hypothetical protein LTS12_028577, partial [Elasticomyces elasticus]
MRLINVNTLELHTFVCDMPRYAAASHRWKDGEEATIEDVKNRTNTDKSGYRKMEGFARYIRKEIREIEWFWIDTCCIDQGNASEVTEAVNSMFRWYSNAEVCIVYLADVGSAEGQRKFEDSAWFCRGWTLQELLAPHVVIFLSNTWQLIGHKGRGAVTIGGIRIRGGPALEPQVARITHIPETVLHDYSKSKKLTPEQKLAWIANRQTKKEEDMYYSLLGLFDVRMWLCYGEGAESARQRLVREIDNLTRQDDRISKVASWLSAPDPRSNHYSARGLHEAGTGYWMLQSPQYQQWKDGDVRHLWLCGKVGSGKTVLFSTIANDVRNHCEVTPRSGFAVFYFSFTDEQKQSYDDLLRSLIYQLGCKDPILSTLFQAHQQSSQDTLSPRDLNRMLKICIESYDRVTLMLDALDECPEGE